MLGGVILFYLFGRDQQVLAILSFGYGILQEAITMPSVGQPSITLGLVLLAIAFGKIVTTSLTIGSGGSGGVFGPSMVIGGCGGGAFGIFLHRLWPAMAPHPASFVVIGMAGFFAAAAKTPFSTLVMVSELTGSYSLLLPTLWVCALAVLFSDEQSIYISQVESPSRSPAHQTDFIRVMLSGLTVEQFVNQDRKVPLVRPEEQLDGVFQQFASNAHTVLPVVDADENLLGVISLEEAYLAVQFLNLRPVALAADLMRNDVLRLNLNDPIDHAMALFAENDLLELPVVKGTDQHVVGIVSRSDISRAYLRQVQGQGPITSGTSS